MKKLLIVLLCLTLVGCAQKKEEPTGIDAKLSSSSSDSHKYYMNLDSSDEMEYDGTFFTCSELSVYEEKSDAYYRTYVPVVLDLSKMSDDEYQWFVDEYNEFPSDITVSVSAKGSENNYDNDFFTLYKGMSDPEQKRVIFLYYIESKRSMAGGTITLLIDSKLHETYSASAASEKPVSATYYFNIDAEDPIPPLKEIPKWILDAVS